MMQSAGLESGVTGRTPGDLRLAGLPMFTGATTFARGRETKVILGPPRSLFGKTCVEGVPERTSFLSSQNTVGALSRRGGRPPRHRRKTRKLKASEDSGRDGVRDGRSRGHGVLHGLLV